jgi:hypothetical protein
MTEKCIGYVINNYSSSGQVQIQRFGHDDAVGDTTKCKWAYVDQGTTNLGVAGAGQAHTLQPGCRVHLSQFGGSDGSYVVSGTFGRMGSASGGGGGGSDDGATSFNDVNTAQSDYVIPLKNPKSLNGVRCEAKAPDGRYHKYAGGQPLDMSQNQYPNTKYKDE